jgi:hypothetical protein
MSEFFEDEEPSDDDGSDELEMEETEVAGEATGGGRGRAEVYCVMESRRTVGNGRGEDDDEDDANGVFETERDARGLEGPPFRDRLRCTGIGMG